MVAYKSFFHFLIIITQKYPDYYQQECKTKRFYRQCTKKLNVHVKLNKCKQNFLFNLQIKIYLITVINAW